MDALAAEGTLIRAGARNLVTRRARPGFPGETVVVKQVRPGERLGFLDWACLRFLETLAPGIAPRALGGDVAGRYFVMEDLGGTRTFDTLLKTGAWRDVFGAAVGLGRQTARLQAATLGTTGEARFLDACRDAPEAAPHDRAAEADRWVAGLRRVRDWCDACGVRPAAGFDETTAALAMRYRDPGEWLAFSHGDPAPTNTVLERGDPGRVRLVDFEYGGYRHALYDVTAWWMLCPLPEDLEGVTRAAYRDELARSVPTARDGAAFNREWAALAAYRALAIVSWLPLTVLRENSLWVEDWTARERLIATAERLRAATAGVAELGAVAATAAALAVGFRSLWPEYRDVLPRWGYLGSPPSG